MEKSIKSRLLHAMYAGITAVILYLVKDIDFINKIIVDNLGWSIGPIVFSIVAAGLKKAGDYFKINQ